jgi:RNA polymerase sigma factor (sigma-70 family)
MRSTEQHNDFQRQVEPLKGRLVRIVWRVLRDDDDSEDALQDALATIWKHWARVRAHPNPTALILRITNDSAIDILRRRMRQKRRAVQVMSRASDEASERNASTNPELAQVLEAVSALPNKQATAILLRAIDGLSFAEIAAAMNCGESTARKHAERARARLRNVLNHSTPTDNVRTAR